MRTAVFPDGVRHYLVEGLVAGPILVGSALNRFKAGDPFWDARPELDRFTPREIIAHLADWEPIFLERLNRMLAEDHPDLPGYDEGKIAEDREYARSEPLLSLERLHEGRSVLVSAVRAMPAEGWLRTAHRGGVGDVTVGELVAMIVGHDSYHAHQLIRYGALTQAG